MKTFPGIIAVLAFMLAAPSLAAAQNAKSTKGTDVISRDRVLRDPEIPATGNPDGDITVVEFFDYQCPYCKTLHPYFKKAVEEDGKVRVISKSWPIFGDVSRYAARLVLATKYQGKYAEAHEAVITATTPLNEARVQELLAKAGIDVKRAQDDLQKNAKTIDATIARTSEQADVIGFRGTPSFIFNTFRFSGMLDTDGFKAAFADARKAAKATK
ncbi:MAG TPA: DsbA family protein [Xanthobacteraceae bacterium]|nr:DsbA family protein [Xanthobacteraceae bacterium]